MSFEQHIRSLAGDVRLRAADQGLSLLQSLQVVVQGQAIVALRAGRHLFAQLENGAGFPFWFFAAVGDGLLRRFDRVTVLAQLHQGVGLQQPIGRIVRCQTQSGMSRFERFAGSSQFQQHLGPQAVRRGRLGVELQGRRRVVQAAGIMIDGPLLGAQHEGLRVGGVENQVRNLFGFPPASPKETPRSGNDRPTTFPSVPRTSTGSKSVNCSSLVMASIARFFLNSTAIDITRS